MLRKLLFPFTLLYGFVISVRNYLFDINILKSTEFDIPIISVGNITIGGTGKTPHVEYLISLLKSEFKLAVLSRGYKRKTKGFFLANSNSNADEIGDEPVQIKNKFDRIIVAVDEKRVNGINKLSEKEIDAIILDDAYQHRYVTPGLSILLIDYNRPLFNDLILPAGNLRESKKGQDRADIIIVTKAPSNLKPIDIGLWINRINPNHTQKIYFTSFKYGNFKSVFFKKITIPDDFIIASNIYTILVVTGIAYPKPLIEHLKKYSKDIKHINFTDHSDYNNKKIKKIFNIFENITNKKKIIITTEKDAVKIKENNKFNSILKQNIYYIPIEINFIDKKQEFDNKIINYVKENKRNV